VAIDRGGWSVPCPGHFTHWKETRYPLYTRVVGPLGPVWMVQKILPPPRFEPWTVQLVVSHYTDSAILAATHTNSVKSFYMLITTNVLTVQRFEVLSDKFTVVGSVLVEIMPKNGTVNVHYVLVCADPVT
jgi:hypothetical protein